MLAFRAVLTWRGALVGLVVVTAGAGAIAATSGGGDLFVGSVQTGLLDPIPLVYRSVNLALLPLADRPAEALSPGPRFYSLSWLIGGVFLAALALNFVIPRFYCRFVCPLGAMFGLLDGWAIWRIGRKPTGCTNCKLCEKDCEGGCEPAAKVHIPECVLCFNCTDQCPSAAITYSTARSAVGEYDSPDLSRRGVLAALGAGVVAAPLVRIGGNVGEAWNPAVVRPPGALDEKRFLERCIKCGQCMRACPTNVLQPAAMQAGLEGLMTPILNNRLGTSGCQYNCVACGNVCPTGAIRPITLDEKHGTGDFAGQGPIKLGTAFVDRNRCLPWAMNRPCIVCQENCPVSPKAIWVRDVYYTVREGSRRVRVAQGTRVELDGPSLRPGIYGTGDYFLLQAGRRYRIADNDASGVTIADGQQWQQEPAPGSEAAIQVHLAQPVVDPELCIGCGTCEHECPVSGRRAIRITGEGETRSDDRSLLV
jgi:ferredoxin